MGSVVNQVQLIGHLGADADVKVTNQGKKVSNLRIATNESMKLSDGKWKEITNWHNCVLWGELNSVIVKYGKKGNKFLIQGSLSYRDYEDKDGIKRNVTEIIVNKLVYLGSAKSEMDVVVAVCTEEKDLPF